MSKQTFAVPTTEPATTGFAKPGPPGQQPAHKPVSPPSKSPLAAGQNAPDSGLAVVAKPSGSVAAPWLRGGASRAVPTHVIDITQIHEVREERSVLTYDPYCLFPAKVRYPDGQTAEFDYSDSGKLVRVKSRTGHEYIASEQDMQFTSSAEPGITILAKVLADGTIWHVRDGKTFLDHAVGHKLRLHTFTHYDIDLRTTFGSLFKMVDRNSDGGLSKFELQKASELHWTHPAQVELISLLIEFFDEIIARRHDELTMMSGGLEFADIERFNKWQLELSHKYSALPDHAHFVFDNLFKSIDIDRDGIISGADIFGAMKSAETIASERRTLQQLCALLVAQQTHTGLQVIDEHSKFSREMFEDCCSQAYEYGLSRLFGPLTWFLPVPAERTF